MKILNANQMQEADRFTIENEPISSIDLMERASMSLAEAIATLNPSSLLVLCGPGNNGGDGLAVARLLSTKYKVRVAIGSGDRSIDNETNLKRFDGEVNSLDNLDIAADEWVIDALFGTGLSRELSGEYAEIVKKVNASGNTVVAIDVPSGLMDESPSIEANYTFTLQSPKLCLVDPDKTSYVGEWRVLPIGVNTDTQKTKNHFVATDFARGILKAKALDADKWSNGKALAITGSKGSMGASVLMTKAMLRSGAGLVVAHIPGSGLEILQSTNPEVMCQGDDRDDIVSGQVNTQPYSCVGVGPAIGRADETRDMLKWVIQNSRCPLVLDADALNLLSDNRTWLGFLPQGSILTPHKREFKRLFGEFETVAEAREIQREMSLKFQVVIVLKGPYTSITSPNGTMYVNSTGNPGLATAGSGDVLCGVVTGLLAQGYSSIDAAVLGTFLHGLSADLLMYEGNALQTNETLIASDVIENLGNAFRYVNFED